MNGIGADRNFEKYRKEEIMIHETAVIGPDVTLGEGVSVGPYSVIEDEVIIGDGTRIGPHAHINGWTTIGNNVKIHAGAIVGDEPQDYSYAGEKSFCTIGDDTIIREYATIHRAEGEGNTTSIGSNCMIMGFAHVGHNVQIGNRCVISNNNIIAGHVVVEDKAIISAGTGVHQFCRVGTMSLTGPYMKIAQDVPPYCLIEKNAVMGLNVIGLKRNGIEKDARKALKGAVKELLFSSKLRSEAIADVETAYGSIPEVMHLLNFFKTTKRGTLNGVRK
jgi:UDP-N-acetylglucosamine acyltransferase